MKLLLDQNLSYRLVGKLQDTIPEPTHVKFEGLQDAEDSEIWDFAIKTNCVIVTFDVDFYERQLVKGFPTRIVWLRLGNMTKEECVDFFSRT